MDKVSKEEILEYQELPEPSFKFFIKSTVKRTLGFLLFFLTIISLFVWGTGKLLEKLDVEPALYIKLSGKTIPLTEVFPDLSRSIIAGSVLFFLLYCAVRYFALFEKWAYEKALWCYAQLIDSAPLHSRKDIELSEAGKLNCDDNIFWFDKAKSAKTLLFFVALFISGLWLIFAFTETAGVAMWLNIIGAMVFFVALSSLHKIEKIALVGFNEQMVICRENDGRESTMQWQEVVEFSQPTMTLKDASGRKMKIGVCAKTNTLIEKIYEMCPQLVDKDVVTTGKLINKQWKLGLISIPVFGLIMSLLALLDKDCGFFLPIVMWVMILLITLGTCFTTIREIQITDTGLVFKKIFADKVVPFSELSRIYLHKNAHNVRFVMLVFKEEGRKALALQQLFGVKAEVMCRILDDAFLEYKITSEE